MAPCCSHPHDGHGHPQDGHGHPQDGHGHPQDGHGHPQDGHGHLQDGHPDQAGGGEFPMRPTRARTLVLIAVVCAAGMWLLLRQVYTSLPLLPWSGVPALALLAIAEAICGRSVRARLRGRGTPIPPIAVARLAVLAKASSLAGAAIGGVAAGFLIYVLGSVDKSSAYRSDSFASGATLGAAALLVAAALYLEYGCRVPTNRDQRAEPGLPPQSGAPR